MMIYIEIIPREITNIIREPFKHVADRRSAEDNAGGCKTLYDAIVKSENVALGLLGNVKPENLLFIFSQSVEAFYHVCMELPLPPPSFNNIHDSKTGRNREKRGGKDEDNADNRAIILCKFVNTDKSDELLGAEKKKGCGSSERYEITWSELQKIKNVLRDSNHNLQKLTKGVPDDNA